LLGCVCVTRTNLQIDVLVQVHRRPPWSPCPSCGRGRRRPASDLEREGGGRARHQRKRRSSRAPLRLLLLQSLLLFLQFLLLCSRHRSPEVNRRRRRRLRRCRHRHVGGLATRAGRRVTGQSSLPLVEGFTLFFSRRPSGCPTHKPQLADARVEEERAGSPSSSTACVSLYARADGEVPTDNKRRGGQRARWSFVSSLPSLDPRYPLSHNAFSRPLGTIKTPNVFTRGGRGARADVTTIPLVFFFCFLLSFLST
jgi:hypothetical protein